MFLVFEDFVKNMDMLAIENFFKVVVDGDIKLGVNGERRNPKSLSTKEIMFKRSVSKEHTCTVRTSSTSRKKNNM